MSDKTLTALSVVRTMAINIQEEAEKTFAELDSLEDKKNLKLYKMGIRDAMSLILTVLDTVIVYYEKEAEQCHYKRLHWDV